MIPTAFYRHHSFNVPQELDLLKMEKAIEKLLGTHDFIGFSALKKTKKSTVRTIKEIRLEKEGSMLHFTFIGDGFLHKMIRILTGTLLEIGMGKLEVDVIDEVLANKIRQGAGETVPANGLFLDQVFYS